MNGNIRCDIVWQAKQAPHKRVSIENLVNIYVYGTTFTEVNVWCPPKNYFRTLALAQALETKQNQVSSLPTDKQHLPQVYCCKCFTLMYNALFEVWAMVSNLVNALFVIAMRPTQQ